MSEEVILQEAEVVAPSTVSLDVRYDTVGKELEQVKAQLKQVEEQQIANQQQLQAAKDKLLSRGLELQGQLRLLAELTGKTAAK